MSTDPDPGVEETDLSLRQARPHEASALARLHLAARRAAVPAMPPPVHGDAETRAWFDDLLQGAGHEIWVAERAGAVVGYLVLEGPGWLHSLYVRPELTGHGIGSVLIDVAKGLRPSGLQLWVFETNVRAQRFYRRHGFAEVERTDGADNEERAPDIRMAWPAGEGISPSTPLVP